MTPFEVSVVPSTALTDLINGIVLLIAFFLLWRKLPAERLESRHWKGFLLMASASCVLGWATHVYPWGYGMMFLLWFVLDVTIMETAHHFFMLGARTLSNGARPTGKELRILRLAELVVQLIMVVVMLMHWHPIQLLVIFAVLLVIPGLWFVIRLAIAGRKGACILLCFVVPLIPCIVMQVLGYHEEPVIGPLNVDGFCHLLILLDVPIVYAAALNWTK